MNKSGKTLTIFLVVISILLLSLTAISIFFYKNENDLRQAAETKLAQAKASEAKLDTDLKDTKKQVFLLEEKAKEADEKINGLMDELELQEGLRDQMKLENASLKETAAKNNEAKEVLSKQLSDAQAKIASLEDNIQKAESARSEVESKMKQLEEAESGNVQLEKIVVTPAEIPTGKIVSVNEDNNFVIIDLGQEHGVKSDLIMSVFHEEKYLGDVKITRAQAGMSVADFVAPLSSKQVKKDDRVMVKK